MRPPRLLVAFALATSSVALVATPATAALGPPNANTAIGGLPAALLTGDVDGDDRPDVVAVGAAIDVHLSRGDGSPATGVSLSAGATDGVLGDVDGDGLLDLVTLENGGEVALRRGDGAGSFEPRSLVASADGERRSVRLADVTGDGADDLVVLRSAAPDTALDVRPGDGLGGFGAITTTTVPSAPRSFVLGPLDGDARADVVVVTAQGRADVAYATAAGGFSGRHTLLDTTSPLALAAALGDLDSDGASDDIALTRGDGCSLTVELRQPDGTFAGRDVASGTDCRDNEGPVVADFDGDGRDDVWASTRYMGVGAAGVAARSQVDETGLGDGQRAAAVDLDGDGRDDLVVTGTASPASGARLVVLPSRAQAGYILLDEVGASYQFGDSTSVAANLASWYGGATDLATSPAGGAAVLDASGGVWQGSQFSREEVVGFGRLYDGEGAVGLAYTPTGQGGWVFTSFGRVFPFGGAPFLGDMSAVALNGPVLDAVATPSGLGYYMVAADGGVFAFGDATFRGSMGSQRLNQPVESLVADPDGTGYWLVAADGGVFAFGAEFVGSLPGVLAPGPTLNAPVVGMVAYGNGYLMVGADGGVFNFSNLPFEGSLGADRPAVDIVALAEHRD